MHDFSDILHATQQKLALLAPNISYFDWETFGDRGSPCYRPYAFPDSEWEAAEALTLAAVRVLIPHGSAEHAFWASGIAGELTLAWITYDVLIKMLARLLTSPYADLKESIHAAQVYRTLVLKKS